MKFAKFSFVIFLISLIIKNAFACSAIISSLLSVYCTLYGGKQINGRCFDVITLPILSLSWNEAELLCTTFAPTFTCRLATFQSETDFQQVMKILKLTSSAWIGMSSPCANATNYTQYGWSKSNGQYFSSVDQTIATIMTGINPLPDESCVYASASYPSTLKNVECTNYAFITSYVCECPCINEPAADFFFSCSMNKTTTVTSTSTTRLTTTTSKKIPTSTTGTLLTTVPTHSSSTTSKTATIKTNPAVQTIATTHKNPIIPTASTTDSSPITSRPATTDTFPVTSTTGSTDVIRPVSTTVSTSISSTLSTVLTTTITKRKESDSTTVQITSVNKEISTITTPAILPTLESTAVTSTPQDVTTLKRTILNTLPNDSTLFKTSAFYANNAITTTSSALDSKSASMLVNVNSTAGFVSNKLSTKSPFSTNYFISKMSSKNIKQKAITFQYSIQENNITGIIEKFGLPPVLFDMVGTYSTLQDSVPYLTQLLDEDTKRKLGYQFTDIITNCTFAGTNCDEKDFKQFYDPTYGNCFTFNTGKNPKIAHGAGIYQGLKLLLKTSQSDYMCSSETAGFKIVIHESHLPTFPDSEGVKISPGSCNYIGIRKMDIQRAGKYKKCINQETAGLIFNNTYTKDGCYRNCFQLYMQTKCGCSDPRYSLPTNGSYCTVDEKPCLDLFRSCEQGFSDSICGCQVPCREAVYKPVLTKSKFNVGIYKTLYCHRNDSETDCLQNLEENLSVLQVYYENLQLTSYIEREAYGVINLLFDISNILGILLGLCAITVFEFSLIVVYSVILCFMKFDDKYRLIV